MLVTMHTTKEEARNDAHSAQKNSAAEMASPISGSHHACILPSVSAPSHYGCVVCVAQAPTPLHTMHSPMHHSPLPPSHHAPQAPIPLSFENEAGGAEHGYRPGAHAMHAHSYAHASHALVGPWVDAYGAWRRYGGTYVHTDIRTYVHTYVRTYGHTDIRTYGHTYIRTYMQAWRARQQQRVEA